MRCFVLVWGVLLCGCGSIIDPLPGDAGRACTGDFECVPGGCCGEGTSAVHALDAPSCSGMVCNGMCPVSEVRCGCGLPVCRDARCVVAVAVDPRCG